MVSRKALAGYACGLTHHDDRFTFMLPMPRQVRRLRPILRLAGQEQAVALEVGKFLAGDAFFDEPVAVNHNPVVVGD